MTEQQMQKIHELSHKLKDDPELKNDREFFAEVRELFEECTQENLYALAGIAFLQVINSFTKSRGIDLMKDHEKILH